MRASACFFFCLYTLTFGDQGSFSPVHWSHSFWNIWLTWLRLCFGIKTLLLLLLSGILPSSSLSRNHSRHLDNSLTQLLRLHRVDRHWHILLKKKLPKTNITVHPTPPLLLFLPRSMVVKDNIPQIYLLIHILIINRYLPSLCNIPFIPWALPPLVLEHFPPQLLSPFSLVILHGTIQYLKLMAVRNGFTDPHLIHSVVLNVHWLKHCRILERGWRERYQEMSGMFRCMVEML